MKRLKTSVSVLGLAALCLTATAALADGMPFSKQQKPDPVMTPLDKALDDIQNMDPPVDVTNRPVEEAPPVEAVPAPAVEPAPEADPEPVAAPAAAPPPVPASRVVSVQPNSSFFGLSVGMYDPFSHNREAFSLNVEWHPGVRIAGVLQPLFGALVSTNGALMGYGGVGVPLRFGEHFLFMPSAAIGAYAEGDGYDLDRKVAYRLGAEVAYVFDDQSRIGLNAHVLTNGKSTGRADRTEVIGLAYTTPMDALSGGGLKKFGNSDDALKQAPEEQAPPPEPAAEENLQVTD